MMNKIVVMGVLLVVLSSFSAVAEEEDSCSGFFGMISCILWGDPSLRENLAGEAFGRNLAGGASGYVDCTASVSEGLCQLQGKLFYNKKETNTGTSIGTPGSAKPAALSYKYYPVTGYKDGKPVYSVDTKGETKDVFNKALTPESYASIIKKNKDSFESVVVGYDLDGSPQYQSVPKGMKYIGKFSGKDVYADGEGILYEDFNGKIEVTNPTIATQAVDSANYKQIKPVVVQNVKSAGPASPSSPQLVSSPIIKSGEEVYQKEEMYIKKEGSSYSVWKDNKWVSDSSYTDVFFDAGLEDGSINKLNPTASLPAGPAAAKAPQATAPKSSSAVLPLTADVEKNGNIVIKRGTTKTGDVYVPVSGQDTKSSGPDDKKVFKYSKKGKADEFYVEHGEELVRVQWVNTDKKYKYFDGTNVVDDVKKAKKSMLVDGKKIKLSIDSKTGEKIVKPANIPAVADTPQPSPIINPSSTDTNTKETIPEYKPLACSGADAEKCKNIISSHVGSGQLQEWEDKKGGIDWSQVQLEDKDASRGAVGVVFNNKEFAIIRKANTGVAVIELHSEPVKGKDGVDKGPLKEVSYILAGQVIATQSPEEASSGKVTVNGQSYFVKLGDKEQIEEVLAAKEGGKLELYGTKEEMDAAKKDSKSGIKPLVVLKTSGISGTAGTGSGAFEIREDGTLTDTIVTTESKNGKVVSVETTYDDFGISGQAGTIKEYNDKKEVTRTLTKDVQLQVVDGKKVAKDAQLYYNGVQVGAVHNDKEGKLDYSWRKVEVNGEVTVEVTILENGKEVTKKVDDSSIPETTKTNVITEIKEAESRESTQKTLSSIYSFTNQLKSYPAISQALYGDTEFYKSWRDNADRAFAPMMGSSWFPSAVCDEEGYKRDIESNEGVAFVKSPSGSYQAVAAVKGERTKQLSPLLCARNPDEAAKELFICGEGQVCGEDQLCYADVVPEGGDGEPDIVKGKKVAEPLNGYMYKISWAVTAPGDERLTPFVTEKGAAISFNIFIDKNKDGDVSNGIALYTVPWIELKNGEHDADVLIQFEKDDAFKEVCIKWDKAPMTTPSPFSGIPMGGVGAGGNVGRGAVGTAGVTVAGTALGAVGATIGGLAAGGVGVVRFVGNAGGAGFGTEMIPTICSEIKESDAGTVVWTPTGDGAAKEDTPSNTVSGGKIGKKASWG